MALSFETVTESIKKNNKVVEINLNQDGKFIQSTRKNINNIISCKTKIDNKDKNVISLDISEPKEPSKYYFKTSHSEVSNLPKFMNDLFESNDYYCLGVRKNNQFLESLLFVSDKNYKLLSETNQDIKIQEICEKLIENLESYYKKYNYKSKKINKQLLIENTIGRKYSDSDFQRYILDFLEINCIELDLNDMSYKILNNIYEDNSLSILIKQNHSYIPILNSFGKQFNNEFVKKVSKLFVDKTDIELVSSEKLLNIRNYKVSDLQELAIKYNISIHKEVNGKEKKKNKQELYDEIKICLD